MKIPPLNLVESFLSFGRNKSLQAASLELGISQPALTIHLQQLQDYFPKPLYTTEGRRKVLTGYGRSIHKIVDERLGDFSQILSSAVASSEDPQEALIRISGRSEILSFIAERLKTKNPTQFIALNTNSAVESLVSQHCDFAISRLEDSPTYLHRRKLFANSFRLIIPKSWKMKSDHLSQGLLKELLLKPLLTYSPHDPALKTLMSHYKLDESIRFHRSIESWPSIIRAAEQGMGWAYAPSIYFCNRQFVNEIEVPGSIFKPVQYYLYYRKETLSEAWFANFKDQLQDCF